MRGGRRGVVMLPAVSTVARPPTVSTRVRGLRRQLRVAGAVRVLVPAVSPDVPSAAAGSSASPVRGVSGRPVLVAPLSRDGCLAPAVVLISSLPLLVGHGRG